jgi:hypothetical protein
VIAVARYGDCWCLRSVEARILSLEDLVSLVMALREGTRVAVFDGLDIASHFDVTRELRRGADKIARARDKEAA